MNNGYSYILHIEDDPNDVLLVQRAFKKAGLPVFIVSVQDGDAAVAYLKGDNEFADRERYPVPDLVLLDLKIPRRSGLEVLEWLRGQPSLKRLPVAVLSSSKHDRDINRAYEFGANSYLVKPVGFDALLDLAKTISSYWLKTNQRPASYA